MDVSTDAYSDSVSAASSSESSHSGEGGEDSYFWQMLTFGFTVEWCVAAAHPHRSASFRQKLRAACRCAQELACYARGGAQCDSSLSHRAACKAWQCPTCFCAAPMSPFCS